MRVAIAAAAITLAQATPARNKPGLKGNACKLDLVSNRPCAPGSPRPASKRLSGRFRSDGSLLVSAALPLLARKRSAQDGTSIWAIIAVTVEWPSQYSRGVPVTALNTASATVSG